MKQVIRLRGFTSDVKGKVWESDSTVLRVGKLRVLDVVLDDASVSRNHAELKAGPHGWTARDLGSTNGTFVNGVRLGPDEQPLRSRDIIQFGKTAMMIEWDDGDDSAVAAAAPQDHNLAEAITPQSWADAFNALAFERNRGPRPGESLFALLRAAHHLVHLQGETELLHQLLNDAVAVLDARRGAIVQADADNKLQPRALAGDAAGQLPFSPELTERCFQSGESICDNENQETVLNFGARVLVLCVPLRGPHRRLGVLYLDRHVWQKPFTEDDVHLADALAAHIAMGIEYAQLTRGLTTS